MITIHCSIVIKRPPEDVWDYTQNYNNRSNWDTAVIECKDCGTDGQRKIRVVMKGGSAMTFVYKLDDKPRKTSLFAEDIDSPMITRAGGSWSYEECEGGTRWTQNNSLEFGPSFFFKLFAPLLRSILRRQTRRAMMRARDILETGAR